MTFHGWEAIGMILLFVLGAVAYISWALIGFNRDEAKKGFTPEQF